MQGDLAGLQRTIVHGRVELPRGVATERIAVLAAPAEHERRKRWWGLLPAVAGLEATGKFTIDLAAGAYCVQLADLATGIVFHTEEEDRVVGSDDFVLRPQIRWLEIDCVPQRAGDQVGLQLFGVRVARPRRGVAFLRSGTRSNKTVSGSVEFPVGATRQRWLVPAGEIEVKAWRSFATLLPWLPGGPAEVVASATLEIGKPEQRVKFEMPPPPSDEELMQRK